MKDISMNPVLKLNEHANISIHWCMYKNIPFQAQTLQDQPIANAHGSEISLRIDPPWWTHWAISHSTWCSWLLSSLWVGAYNRSLATNRRATCCGDSRFPLSMGSFGTCHTLYNRMAYIKSIECVVKQNKLQLRGKSIRSWCDGSLDWSLMVDPLSFLSFQPVLHDWCNKGCGMYYSVCGVMHIKEPFLLIGKSSSCGGSGCPLSLSEWSIIMFY